MRETDIKKHVEELARAAGFIAGKLEQAMASLEKQPMVIPYDNGGGQIGMRRNPWWDAFLSSVSTYSKVVAELRDIGDVDTSDLESSLKEFKVIRGNVAVGE